MTAVRFLPIASGSKGNCYYIETPHARVLLDCGIGIRRLTSTLREHGVELAQLDALLITHTHSDHISGVGALLAKHPLNVFIHARQAPALDKDLRRQGLAEGLEAAAGVHLFHGEGFPFRDLDILPVPVSHDSEPTVAFKAWCGGVRLGVLTDLGVFEPAHVALFGDCDALVLESNHCTEMLRNGPYPSFLKARIAGARGHLSNRQALEFTLGLSQLPTHLMLGHLSDNNNTPDTVDAVFGTGHIASVALTPAAPGTGHKRDTNPASLFETEWSAAGRSRPFATASPGLDRAGPVPHVVLTQLTPGPIVELQPRRR